MANLNEMVTELETLLANGVFEARDESFGRSLLKNYRAYGTLSGDINGEARKGNGQAPWVRALVEKGREASEKMPECEIGPYAPIFKRFTDMQAMGVRYPKIALEMPDGDIVLNMSGKRSKWSGFIQVSDGMPFGQGEWYGRINPHTFQLDTGTSGDDAPEFVLEALALIAGGEGSVRKGRRA